ncbi:hypothetical protein ThrDRAFT_03756 [Frankia casuarinae]|jgi:hypothetical protein|uniref:Uncharacterized protein n=1 Tax=Frankia casuarinae (strain DSM 45818 / CECT 9043 / HFP020203 / CcI3) TaxID=106370 RepID=Q2JE82_FRACC|nr:MULTISPECIES: hypothetical protein [Frankia]ABD10410.1 hypothetical protein Francci3_1027 [Frankia casuarinae]ETA00400.1 hypothetical protein CcI6DRAFT_04155 [Frankia sp. CcI6]EYT90599.1 hypothetical protein ThrDRAFT_03756 [Frankia casuarinae]KEZ34915.1 hypothetical protein CEDDRAFT_03730 [Frankia sp. CeD]KFB03050.1 hypothetical protein ALLO2DRAFT_04225 [Frankia sp. Allo2]
MTGHDADPSGSFTSLALYVGTSWYAVCHSYPHRPPILSLTVGPTALSLSSVAEADPAAHLAFARALRDAVNTYLADCERIALAAQNDAPPTENAA